MSMIPHGSGGSGAKTADKIDYDNTTSGMTAENVQAALDELKTGQNNLATGLAGKAPAYTYGTEDLTEGVSELATGTLYFVYE